MTVSILHVGTAAALAACTTQQAQAEALAAVWSGDVAVRYYTSADALLGTATHAGWTIGGTTSRHVTLGALSAWSPVQDGTAAYCVCAVPAGSDILRADVSLAGAVDDATGRVNLAGALVIDMQGALPADALPSWAPDAGEIATLTVANGGLSNNFAAVVDANYSTFYSAKIVADYSGGVLNPHFGSYGAMMFDGAGHAASNDNSVIALEIGDVCTFRRLTTPPNFNADNGINNNIGAPTIDSWGEYPLDGQPASRHSYGDHNIIAPADGGGTYGTLIRVQPSSLGYPGSVLTYQAPHRLDIESTTAIDQEWIRAGTQNAVSYGATAVVLSEYVQPQGRIYTECSGAQHAPTWFDLSTSAYVVGTGAARVNNSGSTSGGAMIYIPERGILLHMATYSGALGIKYMDVTVSDPSWVNTLRTLSTPVAVDAQWSAACWCADNGRIIVGDITSDADCVFEIGIPATLTDTWPAERVPFTGGQTITWAPDTCYKKWSYNAAAKCIVFFPYAAVPASVDTVYVYRPRNT